MDVDLDALIGVFLAESQDGLSAMEQSLLALDSKPGDADALAAVFRVVHTLKGNAVSLGFAGVAQIAHATEDLLECLRRHSLDVTPHLVTVLLSARDHLREALEDAARGRPDARPEHAAVIAELGRQAARAADAVAGPQGSTDLGPSRTSAGAPTLRIGLDQLDRLLTLTGEIAVARGRLESLLQAVGPAARDAVEANRGMDRLHAALQELVFETRMVPLGTAFGQQQRTVRDLATAEKKQVRLLLEGGEVEVDTSVVDLVRDALTHMVRNAVGHGIESPERRVAEGKDPTGTVRVSARHEGGLVLIEVADDGRGLDRERIGRRAREAGLARDGDTLADAELMDLVFLPGFTTAERVTGTSGRGVGMDVVRSNVERVRGSVALDSTPGRGTTVTLRLPLTIASLDALRVQVGSEVYVLPMEDVVECLDLEAGQGLRGAEGGVVDLRGRPLPYLRLRQVIGVGGVAPPRENVVVVRRGRQEAGLAVDAVLGGGPAVIRPLGLFLRRIPGIAGSVILGSGEIALVLDVAGLLKKALWGRRAEPSRAAS